MADLLEGRTFETVMKMGSQVAKEAGMVTVRANLREIDRKVGDATIDG